MRVIGIRHRTKQTATHEARPTMVAMHDGIKTVTYELSTEMDELDFLLDRFPTAFRDAQPDEDISEVLPWHCKCKPLKKDQEIPDVHPSHVRESGGMREIVLKVPTLYTGLYANDTVVMTLGGSGDRFAAALSRRGEDIFAKVFRISPFVFKEHRGGDSKEEDHRLLVELYNRRPDLFHKMTAKDRELVRVREVLFKREEAQNARIACEQRLRQGLIGGIFLSEEGYYPEGTIENQFDRLKANSVIFDALSKEEAQWEGDLKKLIRRTEVWQEIFRSIEGCGEVTAAKLIAAIGGDVRRFKSAAQLKRFCGVHVMDDGQFPRKRTGELAGWNPQARQALYLLADQFSMWRPQSTWGKVFLGYKAKLRVAHPNVECSTCGVPWDDCTQQKLHKRRYTPAHIHKMAKWRTLTKFVEWLYREWSRVKPTASLDAAAD
jgi:Transposase IS116/IS110/IS902 family